MDGNRKSLWIDSWPGQEFPALSGDRSADVVVIGGGVTGITAALMLRRAGKSVILIDALRVGRGNTGFTTAHLTSVLDTRYHRLLGSCGREGARLAAQSQQAALERMARFVAEEGLDCGFKRVPAYLYAEDEAGRADVQAEHAACIDLGFDCALTAQLPLSFPVSLALRFGNQAKFHPLRYLMGLAGRLVSEGALIYEDTRALHVEDGEPCRVFTENGSIRARDVVVASHVPVSSRFLLHTKLAAYRSYVLALRLSKPAPEGLFWDTAQPYHYVRSQMVDGQEYLIVGGEDHKVGQIEDTEAPYRRLEAYATGRYGAHLTSYRWSGQIIETVDGLPYIGRNPLSDHVYVATGYSGTGLTGGTLAAMIISDQILESPNPWTELYDATRIKPLAGARAYFSENLDYPSHLLADRMRRPEAHSLSEIPPGQGRLVQEAGRKLAAYRDMDGELFLMSPVCPHLGCLVKWNQSESSWDCPCHGSRFDAKGTVISGPAVQGLRKLERARV